MTTQNQNGRNPRDTYVRDELSRSERGRWSRQGGSDDEPGRDEAYRTTAIGRVGPSSKSRDERGADEREGYWIDRPYRTDREHEATPSEPTSYRSPDVRPIGAARPGPHRGKGPRGYQRPDDRIRDLVCEALAEDDQVDATQIEVTVSDGIVTLSGSVPDRPTKRMAEDVVDRIWGVRDVHNQLEIVQGYRSNRSGPGSVGGNEL
ncbi:MAG: BON domain-containing protein [Kofleriaceae bacterium]|nr:BON domain-containing protein [Kofleriaceae bacterium]